MRTQDLLEQRSGIVTELRSLTESPAGEAGDLSSEQSEKFDRLKADLEAVETRIERQRLIDAAERRMTGEQLAGSGDASFDAEVRKCSLTKAIAAQIDPHIDAGREREISQELAKRSGRNPEGIFVPLNALVETRVQTTGGDAGNIVSTDVLAEQFIDALRPASVLTSLGARMLTGLRGDISIPKMDALTPAVEWLATEGTSALSGGDHSFTAVTGSPKHVGLMTEWSRATMLQSNPSIEALVRSDFTQKLAAAVDYAGLRGSGASGQPEGILTNSSISSQAVGSPAAVDWSDVLGMTSQVLADDVRGGRFGWTYNAHVEKHLRERTKVSSDAGAGFIQDTPGTLAGYPVQITSQMLGDPTSSPLVNGQMLFGDFSQVILAFWGDAGADILVNPYAETPYTKGNVLIRAFVDCDVLIRHPEGFCKLTGIVLW
jgi:HK97 family phage major capsid protein